MKMKVHTVIVGNLMTNCYLASDPERKECVIVDPGADEARIEAAVEQQGVKPVAILLTHGHYDHILACDGLRERYGIEIWAPLAEKQFLEHASIYQSEIFPWVDHFDLKADHYLKDGESAELMGRQWLMIETPGHTSGSASWYVPEEKTAFTGDTLFAGTYGRYDFPNSSFPDLVISLTEKLFELPEDTRVHPGHGLQTTIGREKEHNQIWYSVRRP